MALGMPLWIASAIGSSKSEKVSLHRPTKLDRQIR
jgi:hypothetical protein